MLIALIILLSADGLLLAALLIQQQQNQKHIMRTLNELESALGGIEGKLDKAKTEIVGEITKLREALANTTLPAGAEAALARLETAAQALDDIVPDAPAEG